MSELVQDIELTTAFANNEEEVKIKIILPFLQAMGYTPTDIQFEYSVKVKIGRNYHDLHKGNINASGRFDILCLRSNMPFILFEIKADGKSITEEDQKQAISYARLTSQITPFTVVTNGNKTVLLNTYTGLPLESNAETLSKAYEIAAEEELKIRHAGLKYFVGYSKHNLQAFCRSQIESRMEILKGTIDNLNRKYISELFISRKSILKILPAFIASSNPCLAIIGESGVGKTNAMCGLAEELTDTHLVLFYNTADITDSIYETIASDFNWIFSASLSLKEILFRLEELCPTPDSYVIIFLDAIDEAIFDGFDVQLDEFINRMSSFKFVKLILSCKIEEWPRFLERRGNPTKLKLNLFPIGKDSHELKLLRFDDDELDSAESKYRSIFKFSGQLKGALREAARLGFAFRMAAEVYGGKELPDKIDDLSILKQFYEKKIKTLTDPVMANRVIIATAKAILEKDVNLRPTGWIEYDALRNLLGFSAIQEIHTDLFAFNILQKYSSHNKIYVGFYFNPIKHFIMAFHVLELQTNDKITFQKVIERTEGNPVLQGVMSWYYDYATLDQKKVMNENRVLRASIFLQEYENQLNDFFPNLRHCFQPHTKGSIGLAISSPAGKGDFFSFRPEETFNEKRVIVVEPDPLDDDDFGVAAFYKVNGRYAKRNSHDFFGFDPKKAAHFEVRNQLENILKKGFLNETGSIILVKERILAILRAFGGTVGLLPDKTRPWYPSIHHEFPMTIEKLRQIQRAIQIEYANHEFLWNEFREVKHLNKLDQQAIRQNAIREVDAGRKFEAPNISGAFPPLRSLDEAIKVLVDQGESISESLLPEPDIPLDQISDQMKKRGCIPNYIADNILAQYSDAAIQNYFKQLFTLFISEYNNLVNYCFPAFKHLFPFYANQPYRFCIFLMKPRSTIPVFIGYEKTTGFENHVEVILQPELRESETKTFKRWKWDEFDKYLRSESKYQIEPNLTTRQNVDDLFIIRNLVYDQINDEIEIILENLIKISEIRGF